MRYWVFAGALVAGLMSGGLQNAGLPGAAEAASPGKPMFSGMKNENDLAVQQVRDALFAFNGVHKRWPVDLTALTAFARDKGMSLDLTVFAKANFYVQEQGGASVAVFEFVMKGSPTKGAFAMANYIVK